MDLTIDTCENGSCSCLSDEAAAAAWNGEDLNEQIGGLFA